MSKRFTDTEKWDNPWFMDLPWKYKLAYQYMQDKCTNIGLWIPNKRLLEFFVGEEIDWDDFLKHLGKKVRVLKDGTWWLLDFIDFQYGVLDENSNAKPIQSYIKDLKKHTLWIDYSKGINTLKEKERDKEKGKDKEKEKEKSTKKRFPYLEDTSFETDWKEYLSGRKKKASVRAQDLALKELHQHPVETAILMLQQSIQNGWQGIFPLKGDHNGPKSFAQQSTDTLQRLYREGELLEQAGDNSARSDKADGSLPALPGGNAGGNHS